MVRHWVWFVVLPMLLLSASIILFFAVRQGGDSPSISASASALPVTELPDGLLHVDPEEWHSFFRHGRPSQIGWVALPLERQHASASPEELAGDPAELGFVSANVCGECHKEKLEGFLQTAHHLASQVATADSVLGNFEPGRNRMPTADPGLFFEMKTDERGYFQHVFVNRGGRTFTHGERIDIVTGAGNFGQTYLYWKGDRLYQHHASYLTESERWVNSPGFYLSGTADFSRPVTARCLECHATYFDNLAGTTNGYTRSNHLLGVSCVRCHGPGGKHIAHHREHPEDAQGLHIVHPGKLSRQRANEVCAQCHSGIGRSLRPPFSYRPGEPLEDYLQLDQRGEHVQGGVHTDNQLARLKMSRCFQNSDTMTCATCHDVHRNERGDLLRFSRKCLECHQAEQCGIHAQTGDAIRDRCIDCHMPRREDTENRFPTKGDVVTLMLRDHWIRPWPAASKRVIEELQSAPSATK